MAEGEEDSSGKGSEDGSIEWKPGPKKGQAQLLFRNAARKTVKLYVDAVIECLMDNMQAKHLLSLKMLIDMAALFEDDEVSPEAFESFSSLLKKVFDEEGGIDGEVVSVTPLD
jgi:hypothetical protein